MRVCFTQNMPVKTEQKRLPLQSGRECPRDRRSEYTGVLWYKLGISDLRKVLFFFFRCSIVHNAATSLHDHPEIKTTSF